MSTGHRVVSLGRPAEFQRVISEGERLHGRFALMFALPGRTVSRLGLGVSASGKAGSNVVRNRLRRLLREAARRESVVLGPGWDVVLIAKTSAVGHGFDEIAADVRDLFRQMALKRTGQEGAGDRW